MMIKLKVIRRVVDCPIAIKLKVIRRVVDCPIAITKQIKQERNILVRNVQVWGLLGDLAIY